MLSVLCHGWGGTAVWTLLFPIQSDLQLNQPWPSGYTAGQRSNTSRDLMKDPEESHESLEKKGEKCWHRGQIRTGKCEKHDETKQTNAETLDMEMIWSKWGHTENNNETMKTVQLQIVYKNDKKQRYLIVMFIRTAENRNREMKTVSWNFNSKDKSIKNCSIEMSLLMSGWQTAAQPCLFFFFFLQCADVVSV